MRNPPGPNPAFLHLGFQDDGISGLAPPFNWGSSSTFWNSPAYEISHAPGTIAYGDSWATTSGTTSLEYISQVFGTQSPFMRCVGVAATDAVSMTQSPPVWTYPMSCATPGTSYLQDGPSIHFDQGGPNFWAVATDAVGPNRLTLHIFPNCTGAPGSASCPDAHILTVDPAVERHGTVTVNPFTHHAVVANRNTSGVVYLRFYDSNGTQIGSPFVVSNDAPFYPVNNCTNGIIPRCSSGADCSTSGSGCANLTSKVHVATKFNRPGTAYAYVAYDRTVDFFGAYHLEANMAIVDITNENSPFIVSTHHYPNIFDVFSAFGSVVSATYYGTNVGWFYYTQGNAQGQSDPCHTSFVGRTHTNKGIGGIWTQQTLASNFPTLKISGADYVGIVKRGLPGGSLFPTWHQAKASSGIGPCISCQTTNYAVGIFGAQVIP
jgi:hypothetical protein